MKFRLMNYSLPSALECFNNLFRDGFFTEQQAYVVKIFHTVIAPAQFPFRLDLGQLFEMARQIAR